MQDAMLVGYSQTGAELVGNVDGFLRRKPPDALAHRGQCLAVHVFHRQVGQCSASPMSKTRHTLG